ncbi:hypothetical protein BDV96DRAFT_601536 [Lophiotrema nucula]|uniref:Uncharacterized protein n=1 Tax=Lophiotrema nucula TaxID=690887 RepID=A0A6A5Z1U2_9PLEO|nr:hypothetical protein BDV96DRAFT_601536 [Lophiotrema nucula]
MDEEGNALISSLRNHFKKEEGSEELALQNLDKNYEETTKRSIQAFKEEQQSQRNEYLQKRNVVGNKRRKLFDEVRGCINVSDTVETLALPQNPTADLVCEILTPSPSPGVETNGDSSRPLETGMVLAYHLSLRVPWTQLVYKFSNKYYWLHCWICGANALYDDKNPQHELCVIEGIEGLIAHLKKEHENVSGYLAIRRHLSGCELKEEEVGWYEEKTQGTDVPYPLGRVILSKADYDQWCTSRSRSQQVAIPPGSIVSLSGSESSDDSSGELSASDHVQTKGSLLENLDYSEKDHMQPILEKTIACDHGLKNTPSPKPLRSLLTDITKGPTASRPSPLPKIPVSKQDVQKTPEKSAGGSSGVKSSPTQEQTHGVKAADVPNGSAASLLLPSPEFPVSKVRNPVHFSLSNLVRTTRSAASLPPRPPITPVSKDNNPINASSAGLAEPPKPTGPERAKPSSPPFISNTKLNNIAMTPKEPRKIDLDEYRKMKKSRETEQTLKTTEHDHHSHPRKRHSPSRSSPGR